MILLGGLLFVLLAMAVAGYAVIAPPVSRVPVERRTFGDQTQHAGLSLNSDQFVESVDRLLKRNDWTPYSARELELAGLRITPGALVVTVSAIAVTVFAFILTITSSVFFALVLAIAAPIGAKIYLKTKITSRRSAFAGQLDETIQMIASALRAGYSFPRALNAVATESESPTAEEFARIVNENRIGRDLIVALEQTADRMASEDFRWVAEAVAVHRDTGGNLNEVLDRVGATMRERNQVAQQVATLASEGKYSAIILMLLPVIVGGFYAVINPSYMAILINTNTGRFLLGVSFVLYIVGGFWMRAIVNVKF